MKIGLHDADMEHMVNKTFPNYALMKISAWHKQCGDTVEWWQPICEYDKVYSSKVFSYSAVNPYLPDDAINGGTGYDVKSKLPENIDSMFPDYSLYPKCDYAVGYTTRGCPNRCRWCVVPEKEGDIRPYKDWRELVRPDSQKLVLMDNNILACNYGISQLESLIKSGYKIDLNQGMDARLVTPEIASILAQIKWIRFIRFSCDHHSQIESVINACELLFAKGIRPYRIFIYLLITDDIPEAALRVERLKALKGINLYAQAERNDRFGIVPNKQQSDFVRYVYSGKFRSELWEQFYNRNRR